MQTLTQTLLPLALRYIEAKEAERIKEAIEKSIILGPPLTKN